MSEDILNKPSPIPVKVEKKEDPKEKILEEAIKETAKVEKLKDFTVICARLNVRSSASDTSKILRTIKSGDKVIIDESRSVGAWSKMVKPVDGYVLTKFIAPAK